MKSNWRVYTKKADFKAIGERFGIDQVMARIIRNRGLETDEQINMYLNGTVDDMHSPHLLKDADKAADIIIDKINHVLISSQTRYKQERKYILSVIMI